MTTDVTEASGLLPVPGPGDPAEAEPGRPAASLSPSRASDFMTCPLLYRFRVIDRLPEKPGSAATRGTVVHSVLERLFDLPAAERVPEQAHALLAARVGAAARGRAGGRRPVQ